MSIDKVVYCPIGVIHTPFETLEGIPIQPSAASDIQGWVEVHDKYVEGLKDLSGFSHIILLYHFHKAGAAKLVVTPFLDKTPRGVFATRAPVRPNSIGLSIVELKAVKGNRVDISRIDVLNGTPLLDIKPYIPNAYHIAGLRIGWLSENADKMSRTQADDRFQ